MSRGGKLAGGGWKPPGGRKVVVVVGTREHRLDGVVVTGDQRGRELGYPTANLSQDHEGLVPADGVYAGWLVRHPHAAG